MAQTQIFKGTARSIVTRDGVTEFIYHKTAVVTKNADGSIRLDSGGWRTNTTRTAMNQASNQYSMGFRVFQKAGEWFVTWQGETYDFRDGMTLNNVPRGE